MDVVLGRLCFVSTGKTTHSNPPSSTDSDGDWLAFLFGRSMRPCRLACFCSGVRWLAPRAGSTRRRSAKHVSKADKTNDSHQKVNAHPPTHEYADMHIRMPIKSGLITPDHSRLRRLTLGA
ncbi:unnamed protein product [Protopolystoma xenopodis]|uniref:Uncharacterized protein n=1 Tax=Protopolystoma xenopodis TaxID=117903 RepID=A0A3S5AJ15_9PLAT|nr:unnamed protein product [Protopolystoma xenopodis]